MVTLVADFVMILSGVIAMVESSVERNTSSSLESNF